MEVIFLSDLKKNYNGIYPAMAVRGVTALPNNDMRLEVGRNKSISALIESEKSDSLIVLLMQKETLIDNIIKTNLHEIGVVGKIITKLQLPDGNYKVKVRILKRVKIEEYLDEKNFLNVNVTELKPLRGDLDEEIALVRMLVDEVLENQNYIFTNGKKVVETIQGGVTSEKLINVIAYNLKTDENDKLKYLFTNSINERLNFLVLDIEKEKNIKRLEGKISRAVKDSIDENQKEYYLREQLKAIHNELGDKVKKETEIEELKIKILEKKMPENMEIIALKELSRYESIPNNVAESGVIKSYIDFLIDLPWVEKTMDNDDIKKCKEVLDEGHSGLEKVKERIIEYLSVKVATKKNPQTILCLIGPPGVGKTSLAKGIAEALNKKFIKVALGGVKDESEIRGHRRTYVGAMPGRILQQMKKAKVINPLFLIDEIDKMSSHYKGDPASAMLEVLDPEQNKYFSDHYLEEMYDLSQVLFIATANYIENIPAPLRDRMEIVHLGSYIEEEKLMIAKKHLIPMRLADHGLETKLFKISDECLLDIIRNYTREAGVRQLNRCIQTICRRGIRNILEKKIKKVNVTSENLIEYLDRAIFTNNKTDAIDQIGVVNGLAYTQYGGDTLAIEATDYPGNGKLILTGKLGDVMKESANAGLSFVKHNAEKYGIDNEIFKKIDIHIHVPEGAVPKDGPSAGVTMITAIVSALTKRKVDSLIGMTGEITLTGKILPIGGLKEKSIAAHRFGLKQILIPKANEKDIEDIPKSILAELIIKPVSDINEVIDVVLK